MKKIIFLTLLFLALPGIAKAYCSDSEMVRLQKIARNINSSYNYSETTGRFTITLTNLKKDLEVYDLFDGKRYNVDGELNFKNLYSGKHTYIIYARDKECTKYELITINVELPYYNMHSDSEECKGIENYSYCSKWVKYVISNDIWLAKVKAYRESIKQEEPKKNNDTSLLKKFVDICKEYYYIIIPAILLIAGTIIVIENRKARLV